MTDNAATMFKGFWTYSRYSEHA